MQHPDHSSAYDRALRDDRQLQAMLLQEPPPRELAMMFGPDELATLLALARAAAAAAPRSGSVVFLVPGIMGSQLGRARREGVTDLLWLDPTDIIAGRLGELHFGDPRAMLTLGAIPYSYLGLKLRLQAAGYTVQVHDYDWRGSVAAQGERLARALNDCAAGEVHVVAHSLGGLLARAALARGVRHVGRVVTLGTPHYGTPAAAQALRGVYPTVRRLAALDRLHDAEQLAQSVFSSFPSLYDLLPLPGVLPAPDLRTIAGWPAEGPRPDQRLLAEWCARPGAALPADHRIACIVGTGQRTAVGIQGDARQFHYQVATAGDGTVPAVSAALRDCPAWYANCEHSALPRDARVAQAVIALLDGAHDCGLEHAPPAPRPGSVLVSDTALRDTYKEKVDWLALSQAQRLQYLNQLNLAPPQYAG